MLNTIKAVSETLSFKITDLAADLKLHKRTVRKHLREALNLLAAEDESEKVDEIKKCFSGSSKDDIVQFLTNHNKLGEKKPHGRPSKSVIVAKKKSEPPIEDAFEGVGENIDSSVEGTLMKPPKNSKKKVKLQTEKFVNLASPSMTRKSIQGSQSHFLSNSNQYDVPATQIIFGSDGSLAESKGATLVSQVESSILVGKSMVFSEKDRLGPFRGSAIPSNPNTDNSARVMELEQQVQLEGMKRALIEEEVQRLRVELEDGRKKEEEMRMKLLEKYDENAVEREKRLRQEFDEREKRLIERHDRREREREERMEKMILMIREESKSSQGHSVQLKEKEDSLAVSGEKIERLQKKTEKLRKANEEKDQVIKSFEGYKSAEEYGLVVAEKRKLERIVSEVEKKIGALQEESKEKDLVLQDKEEVVGKLRAETEGLEGRIKEMEVSQQKEAEKLRVTLQEKEEIIGKLRAETEGLEGRIKEMEVRQQEEVEKLREKEAEKDRVYLEEKNSWEKEKEDLLAQISKKDEELEQRLIMEEEKEFIHTAESEIVKLKSQCKMLGEKVDAKEEELQQQKKSMAQWKERHAEVQRLQYKILSYSEVDYKPEVSGELGTVSSKMLNDYLKIMNTNKLWEYGESVTVLSHIMSNDIFMNGNWKGAAMAELKEFLVMPMKRKDIKTLAEQWGLLILQNLSYGSQDGKPTSLGLFYLDSCNSGEPQGCLGNAVNYWKRCLVKSVNLASDVKASCKSVKKIPFSGKYSEADSILWMLLSLIDFMRSENKKAFLQKKEVSYSEAALQELRVSLYRLLRKEIQY